MSRSIRFSEVLEIFYPFPFSPPHQLPEVAHNFWSFVLFFTFPSSYPEILSLHLQSDWDILRTIFCELQNGAAMAEEKDAKRGSALAFYRVCVITRWILQVRIGYPRWERRVRESFEKTTKTRTPWRHIRSFALLRLLSPSPFVLSFSLILPHCAALKIMAACNRLLIIWIRRWFLMMPPTPEMVK